MWSAYEILYAPSNMKLPLSVPFKELTDKCREIIMSRHPQVPKKDYSHFIQEKHLTVTDKVLVLDIDQTCINAFESLESLRLLMSDTSDEARVRGLRVKDRMGVINLDNEDSGNAVGLGYRLPLWYVTRPYLTHFLYLATLYFKHIVVYSAGIEAYVGKLVKQIFDSLPRPQYVFSRGHCDVRSDGSFEKPIKKLSEKYGLTFATIYNSIIVDDTEEVFNQVNPSNGIKIPRYELAARYEHIEGNDDHLYKLSKWLMNDDVINAKDVRYLPKHSIFS